MQNTSVKVRGGEQVWRNHIMRRGTAFEVASLITWLLCDQSKYITGTVQVGCPLSESRDPDLPANAITKCFQVIDGGWLC